MAAQTNTSYSQITTNNGDNTNTSSAHYVRQPDGSWTNNAIVDSPNDADVSSNGSSRSSTPFPDDQQQAAARNSAHSNIHQQNLGELDRAGQLCAALIAPIAPIARSPSVQSYGLLWTAMDRYGLYISRHACCLSAVQFKTQFKTKYIIFSKSLPSLGGGDTR